MLSSLRSVPKTVPAAAAAALVAVVGTAGYTLHDRKTRLEAHAGSSSSSPATFQIETDLMDRIAAKPYLQQNASNPPPRRLRILAINVANMRHAFDGECRLNLTKQYLDDIAPAKKLHSTQKKVIQKSIAQSLIKCRDKDSKKIGVELLEASVVELNPHNMRKTHQFGNLYKYDPAKYATKQDGHKSGHKKSTTATATKKQSAMTVRKDADDASDEGVLATPDDEMDAPWNQYAWMEELQIRIEGKVAFGDPLEPASLIARNLHGQSYAHTISSSHSWYEYFLPRLLHKDAAGSDSSGRRNWASNKPHAVIADGLILQRVPGSMRLLQKYCSSANVPLFIVNDERIWGGNTHANFPEALREMRKTIKNNIVLQSMQGSAFGRGRILGKLETETKWQLKEAGRKTRQAVKRASVVLQQERQQNWSELDATELSKKLEERQVIRRGEKVYSPGMVQLAEQCLASLRRRDIANSDDNIQTGNITTRAPDAAVAESTLI